MPTNTAYLSRSWTRLLRTKNTQEEHRPQLRPDEEILPGVRWGFEGQLFTPAYWATQYSYFLGQGNGSSFRVGKTLAEEIAACLLGGHGFRAEIGLAAFQRLKDRGLLHSFPIECQEVLAALAEPLRVGSRNVRYRFPFLRVSRV